MQSEPSVASDARGAPELVALPHCVTATNTDELVSFGVVTVTVTLFPETSPVLGETDTVAVAVALATPPHASVDAVASAVTPNNGTA